MMGAARAAKTVLITGATSGVGLAGAEALARKGWKVLVHARSQQRGQPVVEALRRTVPEASFTLVTGDFASLDSVVRLAEQVAAQTTVLDALWNNAGGLQTERRLSVDGGELQMAVNHLAPFALTANLLPLLQAAPEGRIVATGSMAQAFAPARIEGWFDDRPGRYKPMTVYGQSKLANLLFTQELTRRLAGGSVTAHVFHPGFVRTGFGSGGEPDKRGPFALVSFLAVPPEKGADTGVFLVDAAEPPSSPGLYWYRRRPQSPVRRPEGDAEKLWTQSEALVHRVLRR